MKRRRPNIRLISGLLIGGVLLFAGTVFLHDFQVRRKADTLLVRAAAAEEKGDFDEAIRLYQRYAHHRPDQKETLKTIAVLVKSKVMGKIENGERIDPKELESMWGAMNLATRENPNDIELRRAAADLWLKSGKYDTALQHLEAIRQKKAMTADDELNAARLKKQLGGTKELEAAKDLERMVGYDTATKIFSVNNALYPRLLEAYQELALIQLRTLSDPEAGVLTLNQMVDVNSDNFQAYLIRAQMIGMFRPSDGMELLKKDLETAVKLAPEDVNVMFLQASYLRTEAKYEEAAAILKKAAEANKERVNIRKIYTLWSETSVMQKDLPGAVKILEEGLKKSPMDPELLWNLALVHADMNDYAKVKGMLQEMTTAGVQKPALMFLTAREQIATENYRGAMQNLEKIRPLVQQQLRLQVNIYLSQCYAKLGLHDANKGILEEILERNPSYLPAQIGLIELNVQLGRMDEAAHQIAYVEKGLKEKGEPLPPSLAVIKATVQISQQSTRSDDQPRNWTNIDEQVKSVYAREDISKLQKYLLVIELYRKSERTKQAISTIGAAVKEFPQEYTLWAMRMDLSTDKADADKVLNYVKGKFPDSSELRTAEAALTARFDLDSLPKVLTNLEQGVSKFPPKDQANLFIGLGRICFMTGNRDEGLRLLEKGIQQTPNDVDALSMLYEVYSQGKDAAKLNEIVERIKSVTGPEDTTYKMAEAGRLVWTVRNRVAADKSPLIKATSLLEDVRQTRAEWVAVVLLEADIHGLNGNLPGAIDSLQKAIKLQPGNPNIARNLADLLMKTGRLEEAREILAKLPTSYLTDEDKIRKINNALQGGRINEAIELVQEIVPETSEEPAKLLMLGKILAEGKQYDKAEKAIRRSLKFDGQEPDAWLTLVKLYALQNKKTEADQAIQEAMTKIPEKNQAIEVARLYETVGERAKAKQLLLKTVNEDNANVVAKQMLAEMLMLDGDNAPAMKLVESIISTAGSKEHSAEIAWSRRAVARILAGTGSYEAFLKGLESILKNSPTGKEEELAGGDLLLWLELCARRPEPETWQRALKLVDSLEKQRNLTNNELFLKATLYEKIESQWPKVKEIIVGLLSQETGSDSQIMDAWIGWLLKRKELVEAEQWKKNLPANSTNRIRVETQVLADRGEHDRALARLQELLPKSAASPDFARTAITIAGLAEELNQYQDPRYVKFAVQVLTALAKQDSTKTLLVANVIGKYGSPNEIEQALRMCMGVNPKEIPFGYAAEVAVGILRKHPDKWDTGLQKIISDVEKWMDAEQAKAPMDFLLKGRVAEFHDMLGNLDRVEKEYTEILEQADKMRPAEVGAILNNLAYAQALNKKKEATAFATVDRAISLLGPTPDLIDTRGFIHYTHGDYAKAESDLQTALSSGGRTHQKLFHMALALDKQNKTEEAENYWKEAVKEGIKVFDLPRPLQEEFNRMNRKYR